MLAGVCLRLSDQKNRNPYPQRKAINSISTAKDRSQREFNFFLQTFTNAMILQHRILLECIRWVVCSKHSNIHDSNPLN